MTYFIWVLLVENSNKTLFYSSFLNQKTTRKIHCSVTQENTKKTWKLPETKLPRNKKTPKLCHIISHLRTNWYNEKYAWGVFSPLYRYNLRQYLYCKLQLNTTSKIRPGRISRYILLLKGETLYQRHDRKYADLRTLSAGYENAWGDRRVAM